MTSKQRIERAIKGEKVDRVPCCPFLAYWWDEQPDEFTDKGELEFFESIGADPLFRGHYPMYGNNFINAVLFKTQHKNCTIKTIKDGDFERITYMTELGDLTFGYKVGDTSNSRFLVEHPVETQEQFGILKFIMDNTEITADYERFDAEVQKLGERGLILPIISPERKTCFQSMVEHWVGTENIVYALMDFPEVVEETLASMRRLSTEAAHIAAASNSEFFLSWEDTSTTNISPQYYKSYILPEINEWCEILASKGKKYIQHACGHLNALLEDIGGSKITAIESISPEPTGNVVFSKVAQILPKNIGIVGGIEPVELLTMSVEEITERAKELLNLMGERGYILANSDSCPPGVEIEKFKALVKTTHEHKVN